MVAIKKHVIGSISLCSYGKSYDLELTTALKRGNNSFCIVLCLSLFHVWNSISKIFTSPMYIFQLSLIATDWKILQDMWCMYIWPYAILKKNPHKTTNKKTPTKTKTQPQTTPRKQQTKTHTPKGSEKLVLICLNYVTV